MDRINEKKLIIGGIIFNTVLLFISITCIVLCFCNYYLDLGIGGRTLLPLVGFITAFLINIGWLIKYISEYKDYKKDTNIFNYTDYNDNVDFNKDGIDIGNDHVYIEGDNNDISVTYHNGDDYVYYKHRYIDENGNEVTITKTTHVDGYNNHINS